MAWGYKPTSWTPEDNDFLEANAETMDDVSLAKHFGRTAEAIKQRRAALGIYRPYRGGLRPKAEKEYTPVDLAKFNASFGRAMGGHWFHDAKTREEQPSHVAVMNAKNLQRKYFVAQASGCGSSAAWTAEVA